MPVDKRRRVMTLEFFFFLHGPRVLWNRNRLVSLASGREKKKETQNFGRRSLF